MREIYAAPSVFLSEAEALHCFVKPLQRDFARSFIETTFEACHNPSAYRMALSCLGIVEERGLQCNSGRVLSKYRVLWMLSYSGDDVHNNDNLRFMNWIKSIPEAALYAVVSTHDGVEYIVGT